MVQARTPRNVRVPCEKGMIRTNNCSEIRQFPGQFPMDSPKTSEDGNVHQLPTIKTTKRRKDLSPGPEPCLGIGISWQDANSPAPKVSGSWWNRTFSREILVACASARRSFPRIYRQFQPWVHHEQSVPSKNHISLWPCLCCPMVLAARENSLKALTSVFVGVPDFWRVLFLLLEFWEGSQEGKRSILGALVF